MAVGEQAEQQELERIALPDDRLLDLVDDRARDPADLGELHPRMPLQVGDELAQVVLGDPGREALARLRPVGPEELPPAAERVGARPLPAALEPCRRDLAEVRQEAGVQVVGVPDRERHLAFHLRELRYRPGRLGPLVERRGEVGPACARRGRGDCRDDGEHQERAEEQEVDVDGDRFVRPGTSSDTNAHAPEDRTNSTATSSQCLLMPRLPGGRRGSRGAHRSRPASSGRRSDGR